ncbi:hypothetical protein FUA23_03560 [Neolewinella aurantiaca]|uniref:DUF6794 domain-containing protein n=1 Tax=Neolewinella aurantiaca TaxID=2602767 RepID=A0A5C7FZW7_9BACT|nr:DUF6794 domain-containing protein [Neolewinella aurantiaca]TXF90886.1 hypothetical protein FUA23_03560 [Neolewinella aurantiaca]
MKQLFLSLLILHLSCVNNERPEDNFEEPETYSNDSVCDQMFHLLYLSKLDHFDKSWYIPTSLEESFVELDKMINDPLKSWIRCIDDGAFSARVHLSLGMHLRNNWGLWLGSPLHQSFRKMGLHHPDDMSGVILDSYQRRLKGEDIRLQEQIDSYTTFWNQQKPDKDGNINMSQPSLQDYQ